MNNDTALILLLADRQREIEELRARTGFTVLANGRKVAQVPTGEWVAADDGGWLAGVRPTADAWLTD